MDLGVLVSATVIAAVVSGVVAILTEVLRRRGETKLQEAERRHARRMRREQFHDEARQRFAPDLQMLRRWSEDLVTDAMAEDRWAYPIRPPAYSSPAQHEVAGALLTLTVQHPTVSVRDAAGKLLGDVEYVWGSEDGVYGPGGERRERPNEPTRPEVASWHTQVIELIDLVHVPD